MASNSNSLKLVQKLKKFNKGLKGWYSTRCLAQVHSSYLPNFGKFTARSELRPKTIGGKKKNVPIAASKEKVDIGVASGEKKMSEFRPQKKFEFPLG